MASLLGFPFSCCSVFEQSREALQEEEEEEEEEEGALRFLLYTLQVLLFVAGVYGLGMAPGLG